MQIQRENQSESEEPHAACHLLYASCFPRAHENQVPSSNRKKKIPKTYCITSTSRSAFEVVTFCAPMIQLINNAAIPMLIICPEIRMVLMVAEAIPNCRGSTEFITEWVLGVEKNPNPRPSTDSAARMNPCDVSSLIKNNIPIPMADSSIPDEARILESYLSLSLPLIMAVTAIITGCIMSIAPVAPGLSPREY